MRDKEEGCGRVRLIKREEESREQKVEDRGCGKLHQRVVAIK